jgi:cytochrome c1
LGCEAQDQSAGVKERISLGNNASADNLAPDETVKEPDPEPEPDLVVEEEETPKVESPEEEDPVPSDDPALLLQEGQQIYAERCAGCHENNGVALGNKSEQQILDASSVDEHSGVTWPSADEAKALAAALAE